MSSLTEIEKAAGDLPLEQKERLFLWLAGRLRNERRVIGWPHSVLDIEPVSLGRMTTSPLGGNDDLMDEMLDDRL